MWVKLDDHFVDHPKIVAVGPLAGWLFVAGLCYANRYLTNGFVPANLVDRLLPSINGRTNGVAAGFASQLCAVGLWKTGVRNSIKGYIVHDFLEYQPSRKQVLHERKQTAVRQARWRERKTGKKSAKGTRA